MPDFNLQFPEFKPSELDDGRQQRRIISYLKSLHEYLTYIMSNLDEENLGAALTGAIDGMATREALEETDEALTATRETLIWTGKSGESVGAGSVWGSLAAISQALNGRRLDEKVTVSLTGHVAGDTTIDSLTGRGRLVISGGARTLQGDLVLTNCMTPVELKNLTIRGTVSVSNCRFVSMSNVMISPATQKRFALYLDAGAACYLNGCALYNGNSLIEAHEGVILTADGLEGDGGWDFINGSHMIALMSGTRPAGTASLTACLTSPADLENDLQPAAGS